MKIIENTTEIRIQKGSLVVMAGLQGAGKTFFADKHFDQENIICNDRIFWEQFKKSGKKDMKAKKDYDEIYDMTQELMAQMIEDYSKEKTYTVLDSVGYLFKERIGFLYEMKSLFKNIVLIVINPDFEVIYKQLQEREKELKTTKARVGLVAPDRFIMCANRYILEEQIKDRRIGYKTNLTYIVRDVNNVKVSIDTM
jgi:hypothetical protein